MAMDICKDYGPKMEELVSFGELFFQSAFCDPKLVIANNNAISLAKQFIALRNKYRLIMGELESMPVIVTNVEDPNIFEPMKKRRQALDSAIQAAVDEETVDAEFGQNNFFIPRAKRVPFKDGIKINDKTNEVFFNIAEHAKYWSEFWAQYGIDYRVNSKVKRKKIMDAISKGMDFFLGIPEISSSQLIALLENHWVRVMGKEKLEYDVQRSVLPERSYLLGLKISQDIGNREKEGDAQLKKYNIDYWEAEKIVSSSGFNGFTYKEYLILQFWYHKVTGKYIDEGSYTWLTDQSVGRQDYGGAIARLYDGDIIKLGTEAYSWYDSNLNVRLAAVIE